MSIVKISKNEAAQLLSDLSDKITEETQYFYTRVGTITKITCLDDEPKIGENAKFEIDVKINEKEFQGNFEEIMFNIDVKKLIVSTKSDNNILESIPFRDIEMNVIDDESCTLIFVTEYDPSSMKVSGKKTKLVKTDVEANFKSKLFKTISDTLWKNQNFNIDLFNMILGYKDFPELKRLEDNKNTKEYTSFLDDSQTSAFLSIIDPSNYIAMVKGPPGTGKTTLVSTLVKYYIEQEKEKIIFGSWTHSSINNLIEKISYSTYDRTNTKNYSGIIYLKSSKGKNGHDYHNIENTVSRNIYQTLMNKLSSDSKTRKYLNDEYKVNTHYSKFFVMNEEDEVINKAEIFLGTIHSGKFEMINSKKNSFEKSILIMDEVSKLSIIHVLRYALYAKKIILLGDDMQLPPIKDKSEIEREFYNNSSDHIKEIYDLLFNDSIFIKFYNEDDKSRNIVLKETYRSNEKVLALYNDIFYDGIISSNTNGVEIKYVETNKNKVITSILENNDLIIFHYDEHHSKPNINHQGKFNDKELEILIELLDHNSSGLANPLEVSILVQFAYKEQYEKFYVNYRNKISYYKTRFKDFKSGTIDQLQGYEADIVFICSTYSRNSYPYPISMNPKYAINLQSLRRLNVALSRTKSKIIWLANVNFYKNGYVIDKVNNVVTKIKFLDIFKKFDRVVNWDVAKRSKND